MLPGAGRLDRKGYAARLVAILLLVLVPASVIFYVLAIVGTKAFIGQLLFHLTFVLVLCGIFAVGAISFRRLHDIGMSGLPAWIAASLLALSYLRLYMDVGMELGLLPALLRYDEEVGSVLEKLHQWTEIVFGAAIVLLAFIPGERSTNRFGAPHGIASSLRRQERFGLRQAKLRERYPDRPTTFLRSRVFRIRELYAAGLLHVSLLSGCLTVLGYVFAAVAVFTVVRPKYWIDLAQRDPQVALWGLAFLGAFAALAALLLHVARRLRQKIVVYDALDVVNRGSRFILFLRPFRSDRTVRMVPSHCSSTAFYPPRSLTDILLKAVSPSSLLFWRLFKKQHWNMADRRIDIQDFLAKELRQFAPLVALGVDDIGIAKLATTDETWQEKFRALADAANCILFVPADSTGSLVEFEAIVTQYLNKTIFVRLPQDERPIRRLSFGGLDHAAAWKTSMAIMQAKLGHEHTEDLDRYASYRNGHLLTFDRFPKVKNDEYIYADTLRRLVKEIMERQSEAVMLQSPMTADA